MPRCRHPDTYSIYILYRQRCAHLVFRLQAAHRENTSLTAECHLLFLCLALPRSKNGDPTILSRQMLHSARRMCRAEHGRCGARVPCHIRQVAVSMHCGAEVAVTQSEHAS